MMMVRPVETSGCLLINFFLPDTPRSSRSRIAKFNVCYVAFANCT